MYNNKKHLKDKDTQKKHLKIENKNAKMLQAASTISSFPIVIIILLVFHVNIILIGLAVVVYIWTIILEVINIRRSFKE